MPPQRDFEGRTALISGASRGIGLAIGIALAQRGCNVAVCAKTDKPHPKLPGTIHTAVEAIEKAGGKGLAVVMDVRSAEDCERAVKATVERFGGLDIVINNASAIQLTPTIETSVKAYDLMNQVNGRGTWILSRIALPYLLKSKAKTGAHILAISPPLRDNITPDSFSGQTAYAIAKFGMSLTVMGMAGELANDRVACNALWPLTSIDTDAINKIAGKEMRDASRSPEIMALAAISMLQRDADTYTGQFEIDEIVLRRDEGYTTEQLDRFASVPENELAPDFFLPMYIETELDDLKAAEKNARAKL